MDSGGRGAFRNTGNMNDATPRDVLTTVKKAVDVFFGDSEQFDDMTMLCLQYKRQDGTGKA